MKVSLPCKLGNADAGVEALLDDPKLLGRRPAPPPLRTRQNRNGHYACPLTCQLMRARSHIRCQSGRRGSPDAYVLRERLSAINDSYLNVQQDILETFVDRGQLRKLAQPTITPTGKRIPGLKLDHPRQLAVMHAAVIEALGCTPEHYTLGSLRYDLSKLRAKGLVTKLTNSRRYQLLPHGYSICLVFLKLFERVYAPLTAGLLSPIKGDAKLESKRRSPLDRLYQRVIDDLDLLVQAVGLKAA